MLADANVWGSVVVYVLATAQLQAEAPWDKNCVHVPSFMSLLAPTYHPSKAIDSSIQAYVNEIIAQLMFSESVRRQRTSKGERTIYLNEIRRMKRNPESKWDTRASLSSSTKPLAKKELVFFSTEDW